MAAFLFWKRQMNRIGLIVAVEGEALEGKFGKGVNLCDTLGTVLYKKQTCSLYALRCGAGEIFAASAAQHLIDAYGVECVINFGIAGACDDGLEAGDCCVVSGVVHYQHDVAAVDGLPAGRYPEFAVLVIKTTPNLAEHASELLNARAAICASGDRFVSEPSEKRWLKQTYGASVCEMEAAGILVTCRRNHTPCLLVKMVSDSVRGGASEYWMYKQRIARRCADIVAKVLETL